MRVGLALGDTVDLQRARDADELGLWAVSVSESAGLEMVRAARVVEQTRYVRVIVHVDLNAEHPVTIAEELCVLDNLSNGRIGAVVSGDALPEKFLALRESLVGRPRNGVVVAPPPVQTDVPVWPIAPSAIDGAVQVVHSPSEVATRAGLLRPGQTALCGNLDEDRCVIDRWRDAGCTHLLVSWPGPVKVLVRHLLTRAATIDFPEIVADMADQFDPVAPEQT